MEKLHFVYNNIEQFYKEALIPTKFGNADDLNNHLKKEECSFRGLEIADILKYKYGYNQGLDKIKELEFNLNLGGSFRKYVYDEFDGDDMNYDRLLEGFPAMRKRVKQHGIGSGRLVNIYVVISENCNVGYEEMLNKAFTAMQIVDTLESFGYRVAVWACDATRDRSGSYNGVTDVNYQVMVCLKKHEDSLNKPLIMNGISPWFFRYFLFAHQKGHYQNGWGMGSAIPLDIETTKETIIINHGECLNESSSKRKIEQIIKLFEN